MLTTIASCHGLGGWVVVRPAVWMNEQMLPFLSGLGFDCPPNYNPGDFMLELASAKARGALAVCLSGHGLHKLPCWPD